MSKEATQDPFYSVRDSVSSQVERIKGRNEKFLDLVNNVDTATNVEFKELRKGLTRDIKAVGQDVKGLQGALEMVEKNRTRFSHITDSEFESRRRFISETQLIIEDLKATMDSTAIRRKLENDEQKARRDNGKGGPYDGNVVSAREQENSRFIEQQQQSTSNIILQQDRQLDDLGSAVDRLERIGREVGDELREQNTMLNKLDDDLDDAGNKMNFVMSKLSKLLKTKDGCMIWTIVILFLLLCLLVALVIWT